MDAQTKRYMAQDWEDDAEDTHEFEPIHSQTGKAMTPHMLRRQQSKQLGNLGRQATLNKRRMRGEKV